MYVCTVYIYYVYINTHTCVCIFQKNVLFLYIKSIYNINHIYINSKYINIFKMYTVCVCIYIYIINIHRWTALECLGTHNILVQYLLSAKI